MTYAEKRQLQQGLRPCPDCPKTSPVIGPDGPWNASCLFIGASPGAEDASRGRCFTGYHSQEFNKTYLPLAGLTRDEVRVTNVRKCFDERDDTKLEELNLSCANFHLRREIEQQQPQIIVPMGAIANAMMPEININLHHGYPLENTNWYGVNCTTFPMRHPAESMHKAEAFVTLARDFQELGRYLNGQFVMPVDEYPNPLYEDLHTKADVQFVLDTYGQFLYQWVAIDTETDPTDGFYCLSFSMEHGTGFMVRKENRGGIDLLHQWVMDTKGPLVYHNGMFDCPVLQEVDFTTPMKRYDDTMIRSYHLQYLPQALKELAFRLCGMQMSEFLDVVMPYSIEIMVDYVLKLSGVEWPKPEPQQIIDFKTGEYKTYKPQGLTTKLKRLLTDFQKKPTHEVFNRWKEWSDGEKLPAIIQFGDMPLASIKYVPHDKQIHYSARDADATGRVWTRLKQLRREVRHARN